MIRSPTHTTFVYPIVELGGEELELTAEVRFVYHPEQPDHWNKSIGTWEPGGGGEVEDVELVSIKDDAGAVLDPVPYWLKVFIEENADRDELREAAAKDDGPDPDDARDRSIDDELCDRANRYSGFRAGDLGD